MSAKVPPPRRVTRVQLGILLREWRDRTGLSSKEAAEAIQWHPSKFSKLEKGGVRISGVELDRLIEVYGVSGEEAERARALGQDARKLGVAGRVPDWARTYVELEQAADEIKLYDGELVPGLLQTEDYARALLATSAIAPAEEAEDSATERTRRQRRITGDDRPQLWIVLGEAVLLRPVGGTEVLQGQLQWFRELAGLRHVMFQILPFNACEHAALGTQFCLLEFKDPQATFVYLEGLTDSSYFDRPPHTDVYTLVFQRLLMAAANERESVRMLDRRIKDLA